MKIILNPETPEEEHQIRMRASNYGVLLCGLTSANLITQGCQDWVKQNPKRPGPGSVVRFNDIPVENPVGLRFIGPDMSLRDYTGNTVNDGHWEIGTEYYQYTVVYEHQP
jgi:hypothetical protein